MGDVTPGIGDGDCIPILYLKTWLITRLNLTNGIGFICMTEHIQKEKKKQKNKL